MNWCAAGILWLTTAVAAQSQWTLQGAEARVRVRGPVTQWLQGPRATNDTLPAGDYDVHFAADAAGKPRSLRLSVPEAGVVFIATEGGAAVVGETITIGGAPSALRCAGDPDAANYRITAKVAAGGDGAVGLVARCDGQQFYRFVWDRTAAEFRLERSLGGEVLVLARAEAPPADDASHTLALQVDGFRLEAAQDEATVLQVFDGALSAGAVGVWSLPPSASIRELVQQPVAKPRASAAIVVGERGAHFDAAVTVVPGHLYLLELALDRTHPSLPRTEGGFEPWLVLPSAAPVVMWADWRDSLGAGGFGTVGPDGAFAADVRWPALTTLRKQCVLVRALLVSADGESLTARTPAVRLLVP